VEVDTTAFLALVDADGLAVPGPKDVRHQGVHPPLCLLRFEDVIRERQGEKSHPLNTHLLAQGGYVHSQGKSGPLS